MMRNAGFSPAVSGGITAAAASGGALVPPVMGAGAYMMLEIVDPPVTFMQIATAAIIPAVLYYFSIFMIVHFYSRRVGFASVEGDKTDRLPLLRLEAFIFFGALGSLIGFLIFGASPFRAVSYSLIVIIVMSLLSSRTRITPKGFLNALVKSSRNGVSLVSASACVGIIIGVVTLTGVGTAFPGAIIPLAEQSLFLALVAIMMCSIVLGMGLPSAVCYLLMATLIGPVLKNLGVPVLAAHFFIFYFGMMSMVTPPVALAAYASASIAKANIMATGLAAFRFSLVGFTLPYMFVFRPELLLLADDGDSVTFTAIALAVTAAILGILALAASISGYMFCAMGWALRLVLFAAAMLLLFPGEPIELGPLSIPPFNSAGALILAIAASFNWQSRGKDAPLSAG
jgi:TRAP transporter 4TM/12TM fusion protein